MLLISKGNSRMKTPRSEITAFQDIPNIGPAGERDLRKLGLRQPMDLVECDPYDMYDELSIITGQVQDPCVLDVFISAVRYMQGEPPRKWWEYTAERKKVLQNRRS